MEKLVWLGAMFLMACSNGSNSGSSAFDTGSSRLVLQNMTIPVQSSATQSVGSVSSQDLASTLLAQTPVLTLVASLAPPLVGGTSVQASDIAMVGTKVYVGYNVAGEVTSGGIDVIDVTVPILPHLTSQVTYADTDINKVFRVGSSLYAAGATSAGNGGAVINKITLDASGNLTSSMIQKNIAAYAGVSVIANSSYVYAITGNNGGLSVLNPSDLSVISQASIDDARDISFGSGGTVNVLKGKTAGGAASFQAYTAVGVLSGSAVSLPGTVIDQAKSTMYTGSLGHIATSGQGGVELICASDTTNVLGTMANPTVTGLSADQVAANAATYGNGLIYVANGGAGVYIYAVERTLLQTGCSGVSVSYIGKFTFGDGTSANNVYYSNGFLVVATGAGGFKILSVLQSVVTGLLLNL